MREALVNSPVLQISFASGTVSLWRGDRRAVGVIWQRLPKLIQSDVTRCKRHAMAMNINLTPQLEEMVRQKVVSGLCTSASEVVREALLLMEEKTDCWRHGLRNCGKTFRKASIAAQRLRGTWKN